MCVSNIRPSLHHYCLVTLFDSHKICTKLKSTCILKVTFLSPNFIVEIKLQNQRGQNMFNCVVRPNVCGDGGHIIRLPEYRPGSLCVHNAENLKNLASSN